MLCGVKPGWSLFSGAVDFLPDSIFRASANSEVGKVN